MHIAKATESDAAWIDAVVRKEFPYTKFSPEKIIERISNPNYLVLVAEQENIMAGFSETEFFTENGEARLNCVYVEDAWRGQKVGTHLIRHSVTECERRDIGKMFLLVKETNIGAKRFYEKEGFSFKQMHDKKIDGSKVEVWEKMLPT